MPSECPNAECVKRYIIDDHCFECNIRFRDSKFRNDGTGTSDVATLDFEGVIGYAVLAQKSTTQSRGSASVGNSSPKSTSRLEA